MRQFNVSVLVGLQDRLSGGLAGLRQRLQAFTRLGDRLGLNRIGSALGNVVKQAGILGAAFTGAFMAAGGAALAFARSIANVGDAAMKASARVGTNVETWQELAYAAEMSDLSVGGLERALSTLNEKAIENDELFRKLRIARLDANGGIRDSAEILKDLASIFEAIPDGAEKTALAVKIFGDRLGRELIPFLNAGRQGLEEMGDEARKLGIVLPEELAKASEEWNDNITRLGKVFDGMKMLVFAPLIPVFNELSVALRELILEHRDDVVEALGSAMRRMVDVLPAVIDGIGTAGRLFGEAFTFASHLVEALGGIENVAIGLAAAISAKLVLALAGLATALLTSPIGWFAAGAALIYTEWDRLGPFFESLFADLKALFSGDFEALGRMVETFGALFSEVWAIIQERFDAFVEYFDLGDVIASASASLSSFASDAGSAITDGLASAGEAAISGIASLIDGIVKAWWGFDWRSLGRVLMQGIVAGIAGASLLVFDALVNVDWSMVGSAIVDGVVFALRSLDTIVFIAGELAASIAFAIGEVFAGMIDELVDLGHKIMNAIFDGIKAAFQAVLDWFAGVPQMIADAIGDPLAIVRDSLASVRSFLGFGESEQPAAAVAAAAAISPSALQASAGTLRDLPTETGPIVSSPAVAEARALQALARSRGASGAASDPRPEPNEVELDVGGTIRIHVDGPGRVTSAQSTTPGVTMAPDRGQSASRP